MKILIISKNTYPLQSPRAFRTEELSEELVKMGHQVHLYTIHGNYDYAQYQKNSGIVMRNIPHVLAITGNDGSTRCTLFDRLMFHFFHRIIFWPDVELHFRVGSIIKDNPNMDMLITIAYPHTIHSGAARAKKLYPDIFPKKWIADCGDPFFLNPFVKAPRFMEKFERQWCESADYITVPTEASKAGYFPEYMDKITVIPQGFDFAKTPISEYEKNDVPTFIFTGTLYPGVRDIHSFMDYLLNWDKPYKFKLFLRYPLEEKYEVESNHKIEYITGKGRRDIIFECSKADFVINIKNPNSTQTPSKLIDYGISGRPILEISNDFCEKEIFEAFCRGDYSDQRFINNLDDYRIDIVAKKIVQLSNQ